MNIDKKLLEASSIIVQGLSSDLEVKVEEDNRLSLHVAHPLADFSMGMTENRAIVLATWLSHKYGVMQPATDKLSKKQADKLGMINKMVFDLKEYMIGTPSKGFVPDILNILAHIADMFTGNY